MRADEELLGHAFPKAVRRAGGMYFTPAPLADWVMARAAALAPEESKVAVVDPACGAGAFLLAAQRALPGAALFGLELHAEAAARARARVPDACVLEGDALRGGLPALTARVPAGCFQLWVGNPPYNGTSSLLRDEAALAGLRALHERLELPRGTSLRDDFAFFLLLSQEHLSRHEGALAFVTPASLLDGYLYAPLRQLLLSRLALVEVAELGRGVFQGTKVRTCVTVWTSGRARPPRGSYRVRREERGFAESQLSAPRPLLPTKGAWLLRPPSEEGEALDATWRACGEPLSTLVPVSFPGLKTRFDELLVDDDPERLFSRVEELLAVGEGGLSAFARAHGIPPGKLPKLLALKRAQPSSLGADRRCVRPFVRYAGARHRDGIPPKAWAYCYLERALIPRGDHRLRGDYDPHACPRKLVFNARELPLSAALVDRPGCVHDHQHTRFAPLYVPQRVRDEGLGVARGSAALGPKVPNLSPRGLAWAERLGGPWEAFRAIAAFINSRPVQEVWAATFGTHRELHVPLVAEPANVVNPDTCADAPRALGRPFSAR